MRHLIRIIPDYLKRTEGILHEWASTCYKLGQLGNNREKNMFKSKLKRKFSSLSSLCRVGRSYSTISVDRNMIGFKIPWWRKQGNIIWIHNIDILFNFSSKYLGKFSLLVCYTDYYITMEACCSGRLQLSLGVGGGGWSQSQIFHRSEGKSSPQVAQWPLGSELVFIRAFFHFLIYGA